MVYLFSYIASQSNILLNYTNYYNTGEEMITGEKVLLKFESMDYTHDEHDVCWEKKNYDEINASGKLMDFM